jgi:hypothetical protein
MIFRFCVQINESVLLGSRVKTRCQLGKVGSRLIRIGGLKDWSQSPEPANTEILYFHEA